MKNLLNNTPAPVRHLMYSVLHLALLLFMARIAVADTRQDAINAVNNLRLTDLREKMPDEMKSLEAIFTLAEQHHQANNTGASEQYYKLAIQKARLLAVGAANQMALQPPHATPSGKLPQTGLEPPSALPQPDAEQAPEYDSAEIFSEKLIGTIGTYETIKGDTLRLVAAKLGVSRQHLSRMNKLDSKASLQAGQQLRYNNRKIIPLRMREGIVINIPDRTLYFFQQGKLARSLPVALGTSTKNEKYVWQTPTGKFRVTAKLKDPTWYVPPSIQAEMEEAGKEVIESIPPGPDNPLGKYALKTSIPGILIHSTTKPWSIYSFASHGCIRVYPALMEDFFKEVKVNTPGEIIYHPVKLAVTEEGRIYLEVHHDIYGKSSGLAEEARKLVEKNNLSDRINWKKFEAVVKQKQGIAEDITM